MSLRLGNLVVIETWHLDWYHLGGHSELELRVGNYICIQGWQLVGVQFTMRLALDSTVRLALIGIPHVSNLQTVIL